jgi:hypothetical protein
MCRIYWLICREEPADETAPGAPRREHSMVSPAQSPQTLTTVLGALLEKGQLYLFVVHCYSKIPEAGYFTKKRDLFGS